MFEDIAGALEERVLGEGETLLEEGVRTSNVYILKEGALSVNIDGEELCRICTPESVFGEVSVLLGTEPTATVKALEITTVWVIEDLSRFMQDHPLFAVNVARELAMRLNNMNFNFLEVRSALGNLEERFKEQVLGGDGAPLAAIDLERLRNADANESGIADQPDDMITVKRGKKIVISGIIKKVDEVLHNRTF